MLNKIIKQTFTIRFEYEVLFTSHLFSPNNPVFADVISASDESDPSKILIILDKGMFRLHPHLFDQVQNYAKYHKKRMVILPEPMVLPGGEEAKNNHGHVRDILDQINHYQLDRHSYITVIGGGAAVDTAGYAASIAHRGLRLVRIPTTVLAQNDAAIGVKNGINAFGKKNFLGTFSPPGAVINDSEFLRTLDDRDWKSGISEAIKVALIKDAAFFKFIEGKAKLLFSRDMDTMKKLIYRCAELHLNHIAECGDPFESGSSRPLDFGHWSAHKLEQLSDYRLRHGEAVAIGLALDCVYSNLSEKLSEHQLLRILELLKWVGFKLFVPELQQKMDKPHQKDSILHGLSEFREHLGGKLTIMLLEEIGQGFEVNSVDFELYRIAIEKLKAFDEKFVQ